MFKNAIIMKRLWRLWVILRTLMQFQLYDFLRVPTVYQHLPFWLRWGLSGLPSADPKTRGVRLRRALEALGPIFIKFGQALSIRIDWIPQDIAAELAQLQDRVEPFAFAKVRQTIESSFGRPLMQLFAQIDEVPVASASVAQVHFAVLPTGQPCAVKVLRPGIEAVIELDIANMHTLAQWIAGPLSRWLQDARRLKPVEVVEEFSKHLRNEIDLLIEAGNASQLRRNTEKDGLLLVPEVYWDWCNSQVMTMQRMAGISIGDIPALQAAGIDLRRLSENAVEVFFMQAFRDGFFHADMHPGNIFVAVDPPHTGKFIALDMGIVGSLTAVDKNYLAQNLVAFFNRDYHRVVTLHIESGWVDASVNPLDLESAVRACCEPFFDRPLKDISLGLVLLRLFNASRRFNVEIQPQLVLLQKTIFNVEGLGRQLNPDLDLWKTAKPILEKWLRQQMGLSGLWKNMQQESTHLAHILPQLPRLTHAALASIQKIEEKQMHIDNRLSQLLQTAPSLGKSKGTGWHWAGLGFVLGGLAGAGWNAIHVLLF